MPVAPLLALLLLAGDPAPSTAPIQTAPPSAASEDDIPPGAPSDDYGLVAWCYGALGEYLSIYDDIRPDLKAIDKQYGAPVIEAEPYSEDMAQARLAEKRFAAAMEAAEKASPQPIATRGAEAIDKGRGIWSIVRLKSHRNLVDAWLFWGVPNRCETTSKALKTRATLLGQALGSDAPHVDTSRKPRQAAPDPAAPAEAPPPADPAKPG